MKIDLTPARKTISYLKGEIEFEELWDSKAYQIIREFSDRFGFSNRFFEGVSQKEIIKRAFSSENIDMPGISDLEENLPQVKNFINTIQSKDDEWIKTIEGELNILLPNEDVSDITIYALPTFFYGIALPEGVCININEPIFFKNQRVFVYQSIHESTHTLYGKIHGTPNIQDLETFEDKMSFFNTLLHTEGYAVYAPFKLIKEERNLGENLGKGNHPMLVDYQVLTSESKMVEYVENYDSLREEFEELEELSLDELFGKAMGENRYTYRIGGWIFKELEENKGLDEVREAFYMDADEFVEEYDHLLDRLR